MNIIVLLGGISSERDVSLQSGEACYQALKKLGHTVRKVDIQTSDFDTITSLLTPRPDVVFNALHGKFGEDGTIQNILNTLHIPYTHSGVTASQLCMDKPKTIAFYKNNGIRVAKHVRLNKDTICAKNIPFERPFVIKPACDGSSVGLHIIKENDPLPSFSHWQWGDIMVEQFVDGMELTVTVLDGKALAVTELRPHNCVYDYDSKYIDGKCEHICPADIDTSLQNTLMEYAVKAHNILGCRGVSRTDFRYNPATDFIATLETNTQPGMTKLSLVPEQAKSVGISFENLVQKIITLATLDNTQ